MQVTKFENLCAIYVVKILRWLIKFLHQNYTATNPGTSVKIKLPRKLGTVQAHKFTFYDLPSYLAIILANAPYTCSICYMLNKVQYTSPEENVLWSQNLSQTKSYCLTRIWTFLNISTISKEKWDWYLSHSLHARSTVYTELWNKVPTLHVNSWWLTTCSDL